MQNHYCYCWRYHFNKPTNRHSNFWNFSWGVFSVSFLCSCDLSYGTDISLMHLPNVLRPCSTFHLSWVIKQEMARYLFPRWLFSLVLFSLKSRRGSDIFLAHSFPGFPAPQCIYMCRESLVSFLTWEWCNQAMLFNQLCVGQGHWVHVWVSDVSMKCMWAPPLMEV